MWDTLEVSGLWPIEGVVDGDQSEGMEGGDQPMVDDGLGDGDKQSVDGDQSEGMEGGDDPVVDDGQSVEMPVEEDDQLVEGTDVEHDESLDEEHLDI